MMKVPKIPMIMHEKCMKSRNKLEKKGKRDLPASKDKNLAKILKENDKNWMVEPRANAERERKEKNYLKSIFEKVQICLF